MSALVALLGDHVVGELRRDARDRLSFAYDAGWERLRSAYPVSVSLPLHAGPHAGAAVDAFVWGLLPDNELILERWAKRFQVSARNAFALLGHVGEECAGAIRFTTPDRVAALTAARGRVEWLNERDVAARLRALRSDAAAWRSPDDVGQFSLAGAQPKTALHNDGRRFGVPSGPTPTTHILKPGAPGLDGHAENEHFCLALARELGLPAAETRIEQFEDEVAVVVARYDRVRSGSALVRVHQEDLCQALGVHPSRKYESDGGPGAAAIAALLRETSLRPDDDVRTFLDAQILNWIIAGSDAHAKNYSLLLGAGGGTRLAPLYDVASALPHGFALQKIKLAMKLGGKYRVEEITRRSFEKLAAELRLDAAAVVARARELCAQTPDAVATVRRTTRALKHPALELLANTLPKRAQKLGARLLT